jgi:hypothetical protein
MVVQKIKKTLSPLQVAESYYKVICALNNIHLTKRQLQLLSFTAVKGGITNPGARKEFCSLYSTTEASVNNLVGDLKELHLLVKTEGKTRVNPAIQLDFSQPLILQISLISG